MANSRTESPVLQAIAELEAEQGRIDVIELTLTDGKVRLL